MLDVDEEGTGESGVPLDTTSDVVELSVDTDLAPKETKICQINSNK